MAVAGNESNNNKVESYNFDTDTWTQMDAYPYHDRLYDYATVSTNQGTFIIGGYDGQAVSTMACFNGNEWSLIGNLNSPRYAHSAIINGDNVFIVGGHPADLPTEIWSLKENELYLHLTKPSLNNYAYYPELLLVDPDYCTGNRTVV